ncbi:MAG TPA: orotidine-5'-phosphate decarboxylase [Planctomycetota bacterium]|nr:orotidine-5'-phosphate decarboxylase [Planctomycetota bacterium]HRR82043.1 orotidine-5'-phosphate decarboxylase [Planctomycetota bacterium]HRT94534.1 orotidine-5'-phosphate decarboxylase [Planctomycetota bacterium]
MAHFADRLAEAVEAKGNPCCVGLDPLLEAIPAPLREEAAGAPPLTCEAAANVLRAFSCATIDIVAPKVPAVKVQAAFYERFGPPGYQAYVDTVAHAKRRGLIVIADVKRGDIGSTSAAYAEAHLGGTTVDGAELFDLGADACTINPYFGEDGIEPFVRQAVRRDRGVFVLVRTTNPGADRIQNLSCKGVPFFMRIGALVHEWGRQHVGRSGYSCVGAVVAGTQPIDAEKLRRLMPQAYFLVPGFGAQGAGPAEVVRAFDARGRGAIVSASRSVLFAHSRAPYDRQFGPTHWREAVALATDAMIAQVRTAIG